MTPLLSALIVSLALLLPGFAATADEVKKATDRVWPSLVRIQVVVATSADGREVKQEGSGSGAIINKRGFVITNHHVAGHAVRAVCILPNNEEIEAELVGTDPMTDIAVLKLLGNKREYPTVNFADSDKLKVGDVVLAMGSPLALSQSVTRGIVSNTRLTMPSYMGAFSLDGEDVGALVRWIAHDSAIFPGNSGGPLVNLDGDIVGINEISIGLAGAIPGNIAQRVANELIERGSVRRASIGLEIQPLLKNHIERGALIAGVTKNSPAAAAGLQSGDLLLQIGNHPLTVRYREELPLLNQLVADLPIGKPVEIVYLRDGKEQRASLTPAEREPVQPRATELKAWGITVRNLTKLAALELKRDNNSGVLVTTVRPGGPSGTARPPLQPRDVITAVNGQSITNVAQLSALTDALIKDKTSPAPVMADFERKTEHLLTVVKLALKELDDPGNEVKKAWLPVALQALTRDVAEQMGEPDLTGVRVTQVYTNRSAALAGIRVGDIITALDGERVTARQPGDEETFTAAIRQYRIGDSAELTLQRGKEQLKLSVPLERAPELEREMNKYTDTLLEFGARNLAFADLAKEDLPAGQTGALVIDVTRGGWASLARLSTGDIITTVNDAPVTDVTTLEKTLTDLAKTQPATIVLRVLRGIHTVFVEIEPKWKGATNN